MLSPAANKYMEIVKNIEHEVSIQSKLLIEKYIKAEIRPSP